MKKLNQRKINWIIREKIKGKTNKEIASVQGITPRRVRQLYSHYKKTKNIPVLKKAGRKPKPIDEITQSFVLDIYEKIKLGPVALETYFENRFNQHIPHNTIYNVLLQHRLIMANSNKRKQRKYVKWERKQSMSLWQGDGKETGEKWLIAFMDDASRIITCYGLYNNATMAKHHKDIEKRLQKARCA